MFDRMLDFGFVFVFVDVSGVVGASPSSTVLLFDALFDFLPDMTSSVVPRGAG